MHDAAIIGGNDQNCGKKTQFQTDLIDTIGQCSTYNESGTSDFDRKYRMRLSCVKKNATSQESHDFKLL